MSQIRVSSILLPHAVWMSRYPRAKWWCVSQPPTASFLQMLRQHEAIAHRAHMALLFSPTSSLTVRVRSYLRLWQLWGGEWTWHHVITIFGERLFNAHRERLWLSVRTHRNIAIWDIYDFRSSRLLVVLVAIISCRGDADVVGTIHFTIHSDSVVISLPNYVNYLDSDTKSKLRSVGEKKWFQRG